MFKAKRTRISINATGKKQGFLINLFVYAESFFAPLREKNLRGQKKTSKVTSSTLEVSKNLEGFHIGLYNKIFEVSKTSKIVVSDL